MALKDTIEDKLLSAFSPIHLDVIDETWQSKFSQCCQQNFKVIIVSRYFEGERLSQRHRAINTLLVPELTEHIQRLVLHTYTQTEWRDYYADNTPLSPMSLNSL
ncbi:BolA family protein [Colwelliaceae bacterium 6471]